MCNSVPHNSAPAIRPKVYFDQCFNSTFNFRPSPFDLQSSIFLLPPSTHNCRSCDKLTGQDSSEPSQFLEQKERPVAGHRPPAIGHQRCISCSPSMRMGNASIHSKKSKPASAERPAPSWYKGSDREIGEVTCSAHPARFSPDDKYSR